MSGFRKVRMLHARAVLATCSGLLPSPALAGVVGTPDPAPTGVVIYMAAMLTVLGFGSVLAAAAGRWIWVLYGALAAYAVFWQSWEAQASGGAFWQGFEFTDHFVTRTGTIMDIWAMGAAAFAIPGTHWTRQFKGPIVLLAIVCAAIAVLVEWHVPTYRRLVFDISNILAMAVQAVPLVTLAVVEGRRVRWLIGIGVALPLLWTFIYLLGLAGIIALDVDRFVLNRITLGLVIVYGAVALAYRVSAIRTDREQALAASLEAAEKEAEFNRQLLSAERKYAELRDLERMQRLRLSEASHDIKQPISSLRTTIDSLLRDQSPEVQAQLRQAFDYLEQLASSYGAEERLPAGAGSDTEAVPVPLLYSTVDRMFRTEAEAKGLAFVVEAEDLSVQVEPLVLMRILSNLVSNALRHTDEGMVRLGARRQGDTVVLGVFNSGVPIDEADRASIFDRGAKSPDSDGLGLGLAIVRDLAGKAGFTVNLEVLPGEGNSFTVQVPAKPAEATAAATA